MSKQIVNVNVNIDPEIHSMIGALMVENTFLKKKIEAISEINIGLQSKVAEFEAAKEGKKNK